jgi:hypothetical protein
MASRQTKITQLESTRCPEGQIGPGPIKPGTHGEGRQVAVNIPINAKVACTDGACGRSTNVVVNPVNRSVTHVAIEEKSLPDNPTRLVPVASVADVADDRITLNCTRVDVAKLGPFVVADMM